MLHITMPLSTPTSAMPAELADFNPVAAVEIEANGRHKCVNIQLRGAIAGENTAPFLEFLKAVLHLHFAGTRWTIQMKDLKILSVQGICHLVQFAEVLRARGHELEVRSVHRNVYAMLQDLKVARAFAWAD